MELRHLRYFVAIAEERSFTRAAERLWVAQPGLSSQTRRLEDELGVRLFERHSRGVDLTDAGALFLERARATLDAADSAAAVGRDLRAGLAGAVRLGLATGARWHGAPALLDRFAREHERVELTVVEGYGGTLWRDLRDGRLDAVIAPAAFGSADLERVALGAEPWVVVVGGGHRLQGDGPLSASDLQGEQVVVTAHRDGAGFDRSVAELLDDLGVTAALVGGGPGPALHAAVTRGEAVALTTGADALAPGVVARPLHPQQTLAFQLLWRDEEPAPALRELIRTARETTSPAASLRALAAVAETCGPMTPVAPGGDEQSGGLLRDIRSRPALSAGEQTRLAREARRGDGAARRAMVEGNLRLVFAVARRYRGRGVPFADLVQEGTIGLSRAVERFDPDHGAAFSTYAVWWIRRAMLDAVAAARPIRLPAPAARRLAAVRRAEAELRRAGSAPVTAEAIAGRTGLSAATVRSLRETPLVSASLDDPVGEDGASLRDLVADENAADPVERAIADDDRRSVSALLRLLPARHREVLSRRYGLEAPAESHEEIGARLGVGEERSRQIEREALHRLRSVALAPAGRAA